MKQTTEQKIMKKHNQNNHIQKQKTNKQTEKQNEKNTKQYKKTSKSTPSHQSK